MTLQEVDQHLEALDFTGLDQVEQAIALRGRIVAEAAATSDLASLMQALEAGNRIQRKLLNTRRDLVLEAVHSSHLARYEAPSRER